MRLLVFLKDLLLGQLPALDFHSRIELLLESRDVESDEFLTVVLVNRREFGLDKLPEVAEGEEIVRCRLADERNHFVCKHGQRFFGVFCPVLVRFEISK